MLCTAIFWLVGLPKKVNPTEYVKRQCTLKLIKIKRRTIKKASRRRRWAYLNLLLQIVSDHKTNVRTQSASPICLTMLKIW